MNKELRTLKEAIESYLQGLSTENLCDDSEDLIEFIEMVRDDELIRRMEQAGDDKFIKTPPTNDGDDEIIE